MRWRSRNLTDQRLADAHALLCAAAAARLYTADFDRARCRGTGPTDDDIAGWFAALRDRCSHDEAETLNPYAVLSDHEIAWVLGCDRNEENQR